MGRALEPIKAIKIWEVNKALRRRDAEQELKPPRPASRSNRE